MRDQLHDHMQQICITPMTKQIITHQPNICFSFKEAHDQASRGTSAPIPSRSTENGIYEERLRCRPAMHTQEREWPKRLPTKSSLIHPRPWDENEGF
jgi:hypothetical protein